MNAPGLQPRHGRLFEPFQSALARYGAALAAVLIALGAQLAVRSHITPTPFLAFFAAAGFAAWYCGLGPTLLAIAASDVLAVTCFFQPYGRLELKSSGQAFLVAGFTLLALGAAAFGERAGRAFRQLDSARAQAEAERGKLRAVFNSAPGVVVMMRGPAFVIDLAHAGLKAVAPGRQLEGRPLAEALPELAAAEFGAHVAEAFRTGETQHAPELAARLDPGAFYDVTFQPTRDAAGRVEGVVAFAVNVTAQVKARQALRDAAAAAGHERAWLESILNRMPVPVLLVEPVTARVLFANAAASALRGGGALFATELGDSGRTLVTDPAGRPLSRDELPAIRAARGETISGEEVVWHLPGGPRHLLVGSALIDGPAPVHVVSLSDVTGLRVAESKARESGARFRTLAETIPQLVWQARADGTFEFVNRRWHDYAGTAPVEGTARLEQVFEELTHPDDRERWRAALRHSLTTGEPLQVERRLRGRDGEHRWFLARAQPLRDERGAITAWFCTSTDIDDQKRAERRAHFVAAASEQLALSLDVEVTLRRVARLAVPEFADWCAVDRLDGDHLRRVEVAHPDPRKVALANELMERYPARLDDPAGVGKVVRTREPDFVPDLDARLEALVADQDLARLLRGLQFKSTIIVPMLAGAEAIGAITFATAESDRRLSAADLEMAADLGRRAGAAVANARLYRDAQEASRLKDEFLTTVSHELRTPLTAILGWARLLANPALAPEKQTRAIATIERAAVAQTQLIDDLLDMSRIISGRLRLDVRSTSLPEVIDAAFGAVQLAADAKGVRLSRALDPRAGPIAGDPERLQQVIWNLLANAIKFTPKGGRVQTKLTHIDSHLEIEVSDSGQGIAADFLPHVFERFRQGEGTTTRRYSGLGLGLAIARHITELHGGTLEAASDGAGKGASFTLKLPLSAVRPAGTEPSREHPTAAAKPLLRDAPELTGFKVLVVDDEQDTRELLGAVLQGSRATVRTASSAAEALRLVDEELPDVVVCDIGMPDEDGYALVTRLRERRAAQGRRIPAIAVTAFARAEDRTRALREGFDLHLAKPVEPAELIEAVASLARRARGA